MILISSFLGTSTTSLAKNIKREPSSLKANLLKLFAKVERP